MLTSEAVLKRVQILQDLPDPPARYLVAFSGGVDSCVLVHALATTRADHCVPVAAVHVNHGLHADSADWETHCRRVAAELEVEYLARTVTVASNTGDGLEAAAREARYGVLRSLVKPGDWLLSAHHEDDQAETLLLNLFRGSGVDGLAGIGKMRPFGSGRLVRPLLGISADAIVEYAEHFGLRWIDDPSNADTRFDRNYLRLEILPAITRRWPAAAAKIRQSADLASEASLLLGDLASIDLATLGDANRLQIAALKGLSAARQRNVIRHAIRRAGLPSPPATRLYQAVSELLPARPDAQPRVSWPGGELRRYRDHLYILAATDPHGPAGNLSWDDIATPLDLGPGQGQLALVPAEKGISGDLLGDGLSVRYRSGGEEIRPAGHTCSHKLKKLLQQHAIVPWMRGRIPLLYAGERLVAVADLWLAADAEAAQGFAVTWQQAPALR